MEGSGGQMSRGIGICSEQVSSSTTYVHPPQVLTMGLDPVAAPCSNPTGEILIFLKHLFLAAADLL